MSDHQVQSRDADIDVGQLFSAIWRDKFRILIGAVLITLVVFAVLSFISPKYTADTRVLIDSSETVFTRPSSENQISTQPVIDQENVASQVEIITSTDLLLEVAQKLDLGSRSEFDSTRNMSTIKMGLITLGLISDPAELPAEQRVLEAMRERLDVYAVENSRVIVIEFQSRDAQLSASVPRALAEAYVSMESRAELESTGQAAEYLAREIDALQQGVKLAEERVADFRAASGLFLTDGEETLATRQLAELTTELSRVRAERSSVDARVNSVETALRSGAALDTLPDVISSPLIERLSEQQVALNAQIADLSTTLLPGHPRIKALRSQLDGLDEQIREQAERVLQGLRNEAAINRDREDQLNQDLNELKAASSVAAGQEVELRALEREAASQRALLESYLIRFREARSRDETDYAPANARIISSDRTPIEPSFPRLLPLLGATFFGSLLLMVLVTLMRELFSGRALVPAAMVVRRETVNETADVAVSHHVAAPGMPEELAHGDALDTPPVANDNFSIAALTRQLVEKGAGRAIIVSPEGDAGSTCSVGVVRALSDEGLRAVLIDLTGTGASSQHMLADFTLPGITDLLVSSASYGEIIHADAATRAHIIPTGNADPDEAMRAVDRLPIIMNALSSAYDITIVDCGPTDAQGLKRLTTDDTEIIMAMVEPNSEQVIAAAEDLVAGGYDDVLIVTADEIGAPLPPTPGEQRMSS